MPALESTMSKVAARKCCKLVAVFIRLFRLQNVVNVAFGACQDWWNFRLDATADTHRAYPPVSQVTGRGRPAHTWSLPLPPWCPGGRIRNHSRFRIDSADASRNFPDGSSLRADRIRRAALAWRIAADS